MSMLLHPNCPPTPSKIISSKFKKNIKTLNSDIPKERFKCLYLLVETAMALHHKEKDDFKDEEDFEDAKLECFEEKTQDQDSVIPEII